MLAYSELRSAPRADLSEMVPLALPFALFIEPTNVCNFRCDMCPESLDDYQERTGYYKRMPMSLFAKLVCELKEWGRLKVIRFYFVGEPLLNPDLPEMIRAAKDANIAARIELTSNASILNEEKGRRLVESGLDYLRVSVYANEDAEHRRVTGSKFTASLVRENVRKFRALRDSIGSQTPHIAAHWLSQSPEEDANFRRLFAGISDEVGIEQRHNWTGSDERLVNIGVGSRRYIKQACPQLFFTVAVKANGDITVCCSDWSGELVIGNLERCTLREAWEGEELRRLQRLHLEGRRNEIPGCRDCNVLYNFPDNLDHLSPQVFEERRAASNGANTQFSRGNAPRVVAGDNSGGHGLMGAA